jgi:hypothetical protein
MKQLGQTILMVAFILVATTGKPFAVQMEDEIELTREVIQTQRKAIIAKNMQFTEEESQAFWPVYNVYREAMRKVGDRKVKLISSYADNYRDLTDEEAKGLLAEFLKIQKAEWKVKKKFVRKFRKALSEKKVMRFYQVENKLDAIVNVQLAADIPLAK